MDDDDDGTQIDDTFDLRNCIDRIDKSLGLASFGHNSTPTVKTLLCFFKMDFRFGAAAAPATRGVNASAAVVEEEEDNHEVV
jgi:hypothetical protein